MSNYEATKYNYDGANITGIEGIPTATIVPWSSSSVPSGFLECNGQAVSRSTYAALFAIVSTTYGTGDGSRTFNVPDLQDNVVIGKSGTKALASTGGANATANAGNIAGSTANHTLTLGELPSHSHPSISPSGSFSGSAGGSFGTGGGSSGSAGGGGSHAHNLSATFSGDSTSVVQPYLTVMYIIKT